MVKKHNPQEKLDREFRAVMSFPEGRSVLRHILGLCRYNSPLSRLDNVNATLYNVAQRDLWLQIRERIDPKERALIENYIEKIELKKAESKEDDE